MEYVYTALILHETGAELNEPNLTGVLEAAGVDPDTSRIKAIVAALEGVDIDEVEAGTMGTSVEALASPEPADESDDDGGGDEVGDDGPSGGSAGDDDLATALDNPLAEVVDDEDPDTADRDGTTGESDDGSDPEA